MEVLDVHVRTCWRTASDGESAGANHAGYSAGDGAQMVASVDHIRSRRAGGIARYVRVRSSRIPRRCIGRSVRTDHRSRGDHSDELVANGVRCSAAVGVPRGHLCRRRTGDLQSLRIRD